MKKTLYIAAAMVAAQIGPALAADQPKGGRDSWGTDKIDTTISGDGGFIAAEALCDSDAFRRAETGRPLPAIHVSHSAVKPTLVVQCTDGRKFVIVKQ